MPVRIIPNVSSLEKHMPGYKKLLTKPRYRHFKDAVIAIAEGASSLADIARKTETSERTWWHFFNESFFNDTALLTQSAKVMDNYTQTRSTRGSFLILDYTSTFKTGRCFEWSDWLWNEETDEPDKMGHEQSLALEYNPEKDYRRCLGMRRFYHEEALFQTEYWRGDFEKKPVCTSRLLKQIQPLTKAAEVLVDGEFINGFLVHRFEQCNLNWTGRVKKSLKATYKGKTVQLRKLLALLEKDHEWETVSYLNQKIKAFAVTVKIPSLKNRKVRLAVCKNREGAIAFIGTNIVARSACDIARVYGYRWQIELYFKDIKYNLSFGDYRMRSTAANTRWQVFTLIAANLLELIRKTKLEKMVETIAYSWFKKAVRRMYSVVRITLGIAVQIIQDLRSGGRELIIALKKDLHLNKAKYYLYNGVKLARV